MTPANFIIEIITTVFYIGLLPLIPGTFASAAAALLVFIIAGNTPLYIFFAAAFLILGFLFSGKAEKIFGRKDASFIVIDEFTGIFVSFAFIPYDIRLIVAGFIIFRILDALKPYPAGRLERQKGSLGIMADDIVAGIYTNISLQLILRLASLSIS